MSNRSISAGADGLPASTTSRRLFLTAGAVFGAVGASVAAQLPPAIPLAAAIERHKAAKLLYEEVTGSTPIDIDHPDSEKLYDAENAALKALVELPCTSGDDLARKLEYLLSYEDSLGPQEIGVRDEYASLVYAIRSYLGQDLTY